MRKIKTTVSLLVILASLAGCTPYNLATRQEIQAVSRAGGNETDASKVEKGLTKEPVRTVEILLAATGDVLIHDSMILAGQEDRGYSYKHFFTQVKPYIEKADIAIADFEGTMAGPDNGFSGYPLFNCPAEMAQALADTGFDLVTIAGNHILDKGTDGLIRTVSNIEQAGMTPVGAYRNAEERKKVTIKEIKGVKIAYLAYTYGTNGIPVPKDKPYLVNLLDETAMVKDVTEAKALGADFVIASLHMGEEYQRQPDDGQKRWVQKAFAAGVDVVLASHPHVLQPFEKHVVNGKERFVIYSLGNFISAQKGRYRDAGVIVYVPLKKQVEGGNSRSEIGDVRYVPLWTDRYSRRGRQDYRVLPIGDVLNKGREKEDPLLTADDIFKLQEAWSDTTSHLGQGYVTSIDELP
ncbi:CapA family protein [Heliobacterium mobile]|uniref:CapA family protein n=1 Tax=Heliobacterium mobile TaxID=28064 RepID=UPI0014781091|nr:CapA family protein [Heliobacterium mobile]